MLKILFSDIGTIIGFKGFLVKEMDCVKSGIVMAADIQQNNTNSSVRTAYKKVVARMKEYENFLHKLNKLVTIEGYEVSMEAKNEHIIELYSSVKEAAKTNECLMSIANQIFKGGDTNA